MFLFSFYHFKNLTWFLQDSLAEVEEKYKKAMVSNAQLDNEKTNFMYQVDTLKDMLLELEEQLAESRRQYEEKSKVRAPRVGRSDCVCVMVCVKVGEHTHKRHRQGWETVCACACISIVKVTQLCPTLCNPTGCIESMELSRPEYWSGQPVPSPVHMHTHTQI